MESKKHKYLPLYLQPPLKTVNVNHYNPLIHMPPKGLEGVMGLENIGSHPREGLRIIQYPSNPYKPGPDVNTKNDYGHFVEMGGRRKTKKSLKKPKKRNQTYKTKKNQKSKYTRIRKNRI